MKKFILLILSILLMIFHGNLVLASNADHDITIDKLEIEQYALPYTGHLFIDHSKLQFLIKTLKDRVYQAPENAVLDDRGEIIQGKSGVALDTDQFLTAFQKIFYEHKDQKLHVPTIPVYPKVDSELLANISVQELGTYVTYFKKSNEERTHNISLAAEAINNYVLFPKETFSFNKVVGERTKEKGYKRAPVIVKGELAEDIGGGICQVSSTLFNAVDLRGIQIVERYAHSRSVPYVPPNRDATVSWWGPDFVFKNMYSEPILIRAQSKNGKMVVKIYSSESARYAGEDDS
jgi:vancomycin resistance protein YoaR